MDWWHNDPDGFIDEDELFLVHRFVSPNSDGPGRQSCELSLNFSFQHLDDLLLDVITGVRYNWVVLCSIMVIWDWTFCCYNRVFVITEFVITEFHSTLVQWFLTFNVWRTPKVIKGLHGPLTHQIDLKDKPFMVLNFTFMTSMDP